MAEIGSAALRVLGLIGLDVLLLAGLVAIPLGLSGNFIILGAALLVALVSRFSLIGWAALIVMGVLVLLGEVLEALLGSVMARRYGASKWGMAGAFAGGLLGAVWGTAIVPLVGTILGSFVGTAIGALLAEMARGSREEGVRAGWGALLGRTLASAFKLAIGMGMTVYVVIRTHGLSG